MYFVYILRCVDSSLYCGSTDDVLRRIRAHTGKIPGGAKYTRSHPPVKVEAVFRFESKSEAMSGEVRIKKLCRAKKESLIAGDAELCAFVPGAVCCRVRELEGKIIQEISEG